MTKTEAARLRIRLGPGMVGCNEGGLYCLECPGDRQGRCDNVEWFKKWLAEQDQEGVPVTEFKVGHWYKWVGPKERGPSWSPLMDFMLDGKPHKCIKINEKYNYANFDKDKENQLWAWGSLEHFREVPAPDAVKMTTYKTAIHWVGKQPEIVSSEGSIKSKAQRRREILARLQIE